MVYSHPLINQYLLTHSLEPFYRYIYALYDDNGIFYIGRCVHPISRFFDHLRCKDDSNIQKNNHFYKNPLGVHMMVFDVCRVENEQFVEAFWIDKMGKMGNLVNIDLAHEFLICYHPERHRSLASNSEIALVASMEPFAPTTPNCLIIDGQVVILKKDKTTVKYNIQDIPLKDKK